MITLLTTSVGRHTVLDYLAGPGRHHRGRLRSLSYATALRREPGGLAPGLYVFADLERLRQDERQWAGQLWTSLARCPTRYRTLNHPDRVPTRLRLLQDLHDRGVNDFRAWGVTSPPPDDLRYPVFLRRASDHAGPRTGLIHNRQELDAALTRVRQYDGSDDWLGCEWVDTADGDGLHRKYGASVVGDRVVPRHLLVSHDWVVKTPDVTGAAERAEERSYCTRNPHAGQLRRIFASLGIDYGRADYHVRPDGRVRVWEINTNPIIVPLALDPTSDRADLVLWSADEVIRALWWLIPPSVAVQQRPGPATRVELLARRRANPWYASSSAEARSWQVALAVQRRARKVMRRSRRRHAAR